MTLLSFEVLPWDNSSLHTLKAFLEWSLFAAVGVGASRKIDIIYSSMDWPSMDLLHERLEWLKQKGTWLLSVLLLAATLALLAFWGTAALFFFLQP